MQKRVWTAIAVALALGAGLGAQTADPGTLDSLGSQQPGQRIEIRLTGSTSGSVWGTDVYTTDSRLAVAAVHAGAVSNGQTAVVTVEILPGQSAYQGSARNGVTTSSWGSYNRSFRFVTAGGSSGTPAFTDPAVLGQIAALTGQSFHFFLTGAATGSVWGSGPYTTDSSLAAAAVHAGALRAGQAGLVRVTLSAGQSSYTGSSRNGVTSSNWGSYGSSFHIEAASGSHIPALFGRSDVKSLPGAAAGAVLNVFVVGAATGSVWGSGPYTADSSLAAAAVHSGVLGAGQGGLVRVRVVPGQSSYTGSARNGVTSSNWGSYDLGFTIER